ncbi:unnamed protein product [Urochloa decumbens]|uniref:F-box domain-containing protein n=2 Tax=Urochloa decumbens TaxID=240449 RepID=A0ABC8WAN0_9POAL
MTGRRPPIQGFGSARAAMDVMDDDALCLVLERVDSHVSLICAAAVCKRWRRAIADAAFLRRYRSLHAPAVAGEFHNGAWRSNEGPVFVPSSPSMVDARHLSLDFLPNDPGAWTVVDSRGSLLLLLLMDMRLLGNGFPDMVICEPLTRRFEIISPPAEHIKEGRSFLIDVTANETGGGISISNFRVLCMFHCGDGVMHTAMLTAGSSWSEKSICHAVPNFHSTKFLGRAGGSRYFCVEGTSLVILDGSTGDFTSSVFPAIGVFDFDMERCNFFVTELRDGKPRIVTVSHCTLKVFARLGNGEWALEKSVLLWQSTRGLPGYNLLFFHYDQDILTRGTGSVILSPWSVVLCLQFAEKWRYSINLETMEAERASCDMGLMVYRCDLPWPPVLHAHLDR